MTIHTLGSAEAIARYPSPPRTWGGEALAGVIDELYGLSATCSFATFDGDQDTNTGVILLCGFAERFRTLTVLRHIGVPCLVVQDSQAPWFSGSSTCRGIGHIKRVAEAAFPSLTRWLLLGQSSGGYGALYLSRLLKHSVTLAFCPQTFDDSAVKAHKLFSPHEFRLSSTSPATHPIRDLRKLFFSEPSANARVYIVAAYSEHGNPPSSWLWLDAMHWGRLVDHPDVTVLLTDQITHAILHTESTRFSLLVHAIVEAPDWAHETVTSLINTSLYVTDGAKV